MGLTLPELRQRGWIVFEALSGSRAYNLHCETSDTDLKGIFVQPLDQRLGFAPIDQVASERNDEVYWELGKFVELLLKANPSALELLCTPTPSIRIRHPQMERFLPADFLTLQCKDTFAGYAMAQIKRARGLNKKIVNPQPQVRLGILDFCHVTHANGSIPARAWLSQNGIDQTRCGLSAIDHMPHLHALHLGSVEQSGFRGLVQNEATSNEPSLSSIPKGTPVAGYLAWNKDAYTKHCRDHAEYWEWVSLRNDERYKATLDQGKNYDAKNMMHTFRLLHMAHEILRGEGLKVDRSHDREALLQIRSGIYSYEELLVRAEALILEIDEIGRTSPLPERPDLERTESLLVGLRRAFDTANRP